jgi:phospholipid/cholesterol/gamma-HCH transport system substrate-binding protein
MKNKPFQFRYVNELVGGFVLLVLVLLVAAVVLAGRAQGWFEPVNRIVLDFPSQGSLDLQVGSPVQILGATVGRVERIDVDEEGFMSGTITVKGDFFQFIRTDSQAIVKKKFGIAGDAFIDITKGDGPPLPPGAGLVARKDTDLNELLQELLEQVRASTVPLLESVQRAVDEYAGLAADLRAAEGPLQATLSNIEGITAKIDRGEGPVGALIGDPALTDAVRGLLASIEEAVARLQVILDDVRAASAELPSMARTVNQEVQDLPGTVLLTQEAIAEAERLIEGIQRHWLLRSYMPTVEPTPLIPAHAVPRPAFPETTPVPEQENQP